MDTSEDREPFSLDLPTNDVELFPLLERISVHLRVWADVLDLTPEQLAQFEVECSELFRAARRVEEAERELQKRQAVLQHLRSTGGIGLPPRITATLTQVAAHPAFSEEIAQEIGLPLAMPSEE